MLKPKTFILSLTISVVALAPLLQAKAEMVPPNLTSQYATDRLIVAFNNALSPNENALIREKVRRDLEVISYSRISPLAPDTEVMKLGKGVSVTQAIARLSGQPGIRFVEPDYVLTSNLTSNDPYFTNSSLWGMYGAPTNQFGSNAAGAWNRGFTGSSNVFVGIIDEGIQVGHEDLANNIWINSGDSTVDGIDNDGNSYVDDVNGWDFVNNNGSVYDSPYDQHGTHVAGTIGAERNGKGVVGVNWNVKMISAKFLGPNGGYTSDAVRALDYLVSLKTQKGLNIIATNNSWGGGSFSQALLDAINRNGDAGILFIAAAGNSGSNNDAVNSFPSNYVCTTPTRAWDCVIAVSAIQSNGSLAGFSSYGARTVDLGAPGVGIWSTIPESPGYASYNGTSMATPHVTGAAALCKSVNPLIGAREVRNLILSTTTPTSALQGRTVTGGRLNIDAMITACQSAKLLQDPLSISNTNLSGLPAGTSISLTSQGGSGSGTLTYNTSSSFCSIIGSTLNASAPTTCNVTATKAGDVNYEQITSPVKAFSFVAINQATLTISNDSSIIYPKGATGMLLNTTGGSGTGAVTFAVTKGGSSCLLSSNRLSVTASSPRSISCEVVARKAASGIFNATTSAPKTFTFR